ncbi:MAG: SDR family oxidoreductase [bacterium]
MFTLRKAVIAGIDSDIGSALAKRWMKKGVEVLGTSLGKSDYVRCDLSDAVSVDKAAEKLQKTGKGWEILVMCPGSLEPIGKFSDNDINEWERSVLINFVRQMRLVHGLLPVRAKTTATGPTVLWFAGGGVNNAPINYSAYTVSKIALIKMAELLDAEMNDVCFTVIGPGWVKTKIHKETLRAGERAGDNLQRTKEMLSGGEMTPINKVLDCIDWVARSPREEVGGRNISAACDDWGSDRLNRVLAEDRNMYKLRRYGN